MTNFTEQFTATLNATLEKMVAEAVAKVTAQYELQLVEMQARIMELEDSVTNPLDIDGDIEKFIEQYDFSTVVQEHVDTDRLFEGCEFADAVKTVVADAMGGNGRRRY
jgi:hypothetical protein